MSSAGIQDFEKRFEEFRYKPDLTLQFSESEVQEYLKQVSQSDLPYRMYPVYDALFTKFAQHIWLPFILQLLDRFPLHPKGFAYSSSRSRRAIKDAAGNYEYFETFHPGMQLIDAAFEKFPELFKDRLHLIFINELNLFAEEDVILWEKYGNNYFDFFKKYIEGERSDLELAQALIKMFRAGGEKLHELGVECLKKRFSNGDGIGFINQFLVECGLEYNGNELRRLHSQKPLHLIFPKGFVKEDDEDDSWKPLHPLPGNYNWGGWLTIQKKSGKKIKLHHLLTLDPVPPSLGINSVKQLELVVNMDVSDEDGTDQYYRHNELGQLMPEKEDVRIYDGPGDYVPNQPAFTECQLQISDQGEKYRLQGWEHSQNINRLGGMPFFVQDYHYPKCCDCSKTMKFILQLDSHLPQENGNDYWWGSGGLAYMYWCDDCRVSSLCWFCT
jgi:hypothetical protein